jgi:hypothetical protein
LATKRPTLRSGASRDESSPIDPDAGSSSERYERSDREPEFAAVIDDRDDGDSGRETAHRPAQLVAARHAATAVTSLDDAYPRLDTASIMSAAS